MIKSTFKLEKELQEAGYEIIIGIDEAGKGPLAGPVVAAAAALKKNFPPRPLAGEDAQRAGEGTLRYCVYPSSAQPFADKKLDTFSQGAKEISSFDLIRDSKTLSAKQRESLFDFVHEHFHIGVGICDHKTIDRMNIFQASFLAMKKALTSLRREISKSQFSISKQFPNYNNQISKNTEYKMQDNKYIILLDGNSLIPNFSGEQRAIVRGDKTVKSISAASIVAKVTRDRIMLEMHKKYPFYNFDKHKGYGTKLHMETLKKHGPCEIHRKSFAPVKLAKTTK